MGGWGPMDMLKALNKVGERWLIHFFNFAWRSGAVPMDWQTKKVVLIHKQKNLITGVSQNIVSQKKLNKVCYCANESFMCIISFYYHVPLYLLWKVI